MKKSVIFLILSIALIVILSVVVLNRGDTEPQRYGAIGKDTVISWGDGMFQIVNVAGNRALVIYENEYRSQTILNHVSRYHKNNEFLYVIGENGYAVVNRKNNSCRVYVDGAKSGKIESENIRYLTTFAEFTQKDTAYFEDVR